MSDPPANRKPTILVLASTYPRWQADPEPGFVHELAKRLTGKFRVVALVPSSPECLKSEIMDGVEVRRYRYAPKALETLVNNGGILANLRRWNAYRLVKRERVAAVHAHWLVPQGLVAAFLTLLPVRAPGFLVTSHGADLFALRGWLLGRLKAWIALRASAISVVSEEMRGELARLGVPTDRIMVRSMGVDLSQRFTPPGPGDAPRSRKQILFVGRLVEKKGLRHLIDAMPAILESQEDARLTIVGFGPEELERKAQARALGLDDRIEFLGAVGQAHLPALYRRAAVFVAPFVEAGSGDREGLGLVVVEAAACGCPVVVSNLRSTMDVFRDASPAAVVEQGSPRAIAEAVVKVLNAPGDTEGLRSSLQSRFDWPGVAEAYSQILLGIARKTPRS